MSEYVKAYQLFFLSMRYALFAKNNASAYFFCEENMFASSYIAAAFPGSLRMTSENSDAALSRLPKTFSLLALKKTFMISAFCASLIVADAVFTGFSVLL